MIMIQLTEKAEAHFLKIIQPAQSVVLSTKRSGCSGLKYCLELRDQFEVSLYQPLESKHGLAFFVEKKSLPYLKGLVIDWVTEGLQSRIVYNNPQESGKCGCGESFSVGD